MQSGFFSKGFAAICGCQARRSKLIQNYFRLIVVLKTHKVSGGTDLGDGNTALAYKFQNILKLLVLAPDEVYN
ncbi:hypothetical protein GCM10007422_29610 [Pedobacter zeae]|uniref:Uncharacterized protein n=1 Tax=Pedobacter zeae TaxID=1737356 RepID=A0ABQ1Y2U3_9SPHI|nr:hypothetical protein GCM10007422_29610 [Pedobacter zeae]